MYGTVCRFQIKPGMEAKLVSYSKEVDQVNVPGVRAEYIYRMDNNPNEYFMTVVFDSEESYKRNAASPEQHARYQKFRDLLVADPEWHDGMIVHSSIESPVR